MKVKPVTQRHHLVYGPGQGSKNREITRRVRRGVHFAITQLRRYSFLTDEEINTIHLEAELRRRFPEEEDMEYGKGSEESL